MNAISGIDESGLDAEERAEKAQADAIAGAQQKDAASSAEGQEPDGPKGKPDKKQAEGRYKSENRNLKNEIDYLRTQLEVKTMESAQPKGEPEKITIEGKDDDFTTVAQVERRLAVLEDRLAGTEKQQKAMTQSQLSDKMLQIDLKGNALFPDYDEKSTAVSRQMQMEQQRQGSSVTLATILNARNPARVVYNLGRDILGDESDPGAENRQIADNAEKGKTLAGVKTSGSDSQGMTYEKYAALPSDEFAEVKAKLGPAGIKRMKDDYFKRKKTAY